MQTFPAAEKCQAFSKELNMLNRLLPNKIAAVLLIVGMVAVSGCGGGGSGSGTGGGGSLDSGVPGGYHSGDRVKLSGCVADKNGVPISGVTITVYYNNENSKVTATTDAAGLYTVSGVASGAWSDHSVYAEKAGFGFYPWVGDPAGIVAKCDFWGYYRTVIRFLTVPLRDLTNVNFIASRPGDRQASLPRTGQTVSYAPGDDYSVQAGVAWPGTRFVDNLNGTVTDHLTGLVWLKNAGCFTPGDWSSALTAANQLAAGQCGLSDGSTPGQWRMPNINELESLVDSSQSNPALPAGAPFTAINQVNAYWSSTTYNALNSNAFAIRFTDGRWINGIDGSFNNSKTLSSNSLWAVKSGAAGAIRLLATGVFSGQGGGAGISYGINDDAALQIGAPLTSPRFIDNGNGTLSDTVTGLTWLKQADCIQHSWSGALATIGSLSSGQCGLTDGSSAGQWRMPNRGEMLTLADRAPSFPLANYYNGIPGADGVTVINPVIFNNFMVSNYYWTSTTSAADTSQAWTVYSCDFGVYNLDKSTTGYALAVR
jgi:hypothetical protein